MRDAPQLGAGFAREVAALAWARRTGVDADAAGGLSKVTRTA